MSRDLVLTNCKCQLRVVCINYNYGYVFYITNKNKAIQGLSRISPIKTAHPAYRHIFLSHVSPFILGLSRIPQRKINLSRIPPHFSIPHPANNFRLIPYPATEKSWIPHPAKPRHPPMKNP